MSVPSPADATQSGTAAATESGSPRPLMRPGRYAVGMFGTSLPINMFVTFMAFFYIDSRGLDVRAYAAVMGIYALIDAIDNPIYGFASDRTRTRWGRRRPWLVIGAPLSALAFIMFFSPPAALAGGGLIAWFAVFTVLTGTFDSLVNVNYGALLPELFRDEGARAKANSLRQGWQLLAMVISIALTPLITSAIGLTPTAIIFGTASVIVVIYMATGVVEDPAALAADPAPLWGTIKAIVSEKKFWLIALTSGTYSAGMVVVLAAVPFFVKYTLGLPPAQSSYLLGTVILTSAVFLALWTWVIRRIGPEATWRIALATLAVALGLMSLATTLVTTLVLGALVGLGYSGVMATMDLIVARLLDEDAARTGQRREGMFLAAFGFFNRLNAAVKSVAFLLAFSLFGFASGDNPGPAPDEAARFLLSTFPFILMSIAALLSLTVRFDRTLVVPPAPAPTDAPAGASASQD